MYVYAKAKWDNIKQDLRNFVEQLSTSLNKKGLSMDRHIPSKMTSR